ncbi:MULTISPECIES: YbaB/EbfC family nucleoid-associated protein [Micromonospora]|uniref:YbaB/EbfC family nucleoid-associated protein n=1 Tax=Micromonospora TaxID=1873 RepID=UPI001B39AA06|nr:MULTISPECIES: YbaB/EbfC family nucleoid-associated protein [unclassified Micromonospora]MBQ0977414.1 YbaB/EbfC family nucleoid-associated protein [Micromonospora sp. M61]MBQ1035937.1 YbaB/EbfC family nucleoid-associated protein [Micromonospora sp. C81]WTI20426.1 YbaB/EbfC family nucleoid-associated protein [Micromonospora zamorensis]
MTYPSDLNRSISELLSTLGRNDAGSAAEAAPVVQGVGEAADGMVRVVALPGGQIESVWIDPRLMRSASETLAEHVREATNAALTDLRSAVAAVAVAPDTTALLEQLREVQRSAVPQLQGIIDTLGDVQDRLSSGRRP